MSGGKHLPAAVETRPAKIDVAFILVGKFVRVNGYGDQIVVEGMRKTCIYIYRPGCGGMPKSFSPRKHRSSTVGGDVEKDAKMS